MLPTSTPRDSRSAALAVRAAIALSGGGDVGNHVGRVVAAVVYIGEVVARLVGTGY